MFDGAKKPGAKILVSGGTRCNVTNTIVRDTDFWGGSRTTVRRILRAFPAGETVAFFGELGVPLHEEADGKLFPDSNRARDVLDALLRESERVGAVLHAGHRVLDIARDGERFRLSTSQGSVSAHAVVLATGGLSLPKTGSDGAGLGFAERLGHTIVPTTPGLAPLVLSDEPGGSFHRVLAGVAQDVELTLWIGGSVGLRLSGALLWTHFGVSGPVALNMSRHWLRATLEGRRVAVTVNVCPGQRFEDVDARLIALAREHPRASVQKALSGTVPASFAAALLQRLDVAAETPVAQLPREDRRRLIRALVEWPLAVIGTRGYNHAEVTAGGVSLLEIDPATMQSRRCPGLFLVGEILDVDGRIGGFNFQWAWATGFVAGRAVGQRAEGTGQRAEGTGQRAEGTRQRAKGKRSQRQK